MKIKVNESELKFEGKIKLTPKLVGEMLAGFPEKKRLKFLLDVIDFINQKHKKRFLCLAEYVETEQEDLPRLWVISDSLFDWVDDAPLCQEGFCSKCKVGVTSWAKDAICFICGNDVYLT